MAIGVERCVEVPTNAAMNQVGREHAMSQRSAHRLAWVSAWLAGCLVAGGLLLSLLASVTTNGAIHLAPHQFFNPLITLAFSSVGALVAARHPRNPIGWMLGATGFLSALDLLALGYSLYSS